jgi:asparagine synthase (glutamine-hydrolysing)
MKIEILLSDQRSTWNKLKQKNNTLWYVGKVIVGNRFISDTGELYRLFDNLDVLDKNKVETILANIDGFFSIVFENEDYALAIVDRTRSHPIFFTRNGEPVIISDSARAIKGRCDLNQQNDIGVFEFLLCGYVTGNQTLYEDMNQLLPGQYLFINKTTGEISIRSYFIYYPSERDRDQLNQNEVLEKYRSLMKSSFNRLKTFIVTKGYQPVIPLSGGRDSRLMAILLKEYGFDQTICFTFGTENHPEVIKSQAVAELLGLEWRFAPYTKEKWNEVYRSLSMSKYFEFSDGLSVKPHFMDFIAVKELFGYQGGNYLFLPGHSLDFIAGSHIPQMLISMERPRIQKLYTSILYKHFNFHHIYPEQKRIIIDRIRSALEDIPTTDKNEIIAAFEYWDWCERQGKFILNALNVYDFFGYDWYIPFWELDWMEFFMGLPYSWRYKQNFQRLALWNFYPDYFEKPSHWIEGKRKITQELIRLIKQTALGESIIYHLNKIRRRNYISLTRDYGLKRYGAFDVEADSLEAFARKHARHTDIKRFFYFFTLDYLIRNSVSLDFLPKQYESTFLKESNTKSDSSLDGYV